MRIPLNECPECKEAIYDDLKPCPHCGSKLKKARVGWILGIVLAVLILVGVAIELASRKDGPGGGRGRGGAGESSKDLAESTKIGNAFIEEFAGYLPDDAPGFIYLNVPRLDEQIRSAAVKEGLVDVSLQALHEAVGLALRGDSDRKAKLLGSLFEFEGAWEDLRDLHIAVALLGFDEVKRDEVPRILIAVGPGGALELFEKYKVRAVLEEIVGAPFQEKLIDGVQARYVPVGEGLEVAYGWQGETLLVGFPASTLDEALSNARSGNMTVRSERSYASFAEEMSHNGVVKAYVNTDALIKSLTKLRNLGVDFGDIESRLGEETLPKIALNFDMSDGANLRLWADTAGTRYEELPSWSAKLPSGPFDALEYMPDDMDVVAAAHLGDFEELWDHVRRGLEDDDSDALEKIDRGLEMIKEQSGVDVERLLPAIGDEIAFGWKLASPGGGRLPRGAQWLVAVKVRGSGIHDALLEALSQQVTFRSRKIGGKKASVAVKRDGTGGEAGLAFLQKGKILLVASGSKVLANAIEAAKDESIETTDEWKDAFESVDKRNLSACAFVTRRLWWKVPAKAESDWRQALDRIGTIAMSASRRENIVRGRIWVEKAPLLAAWALGKSLKEIDGVPERRAAAQATACKIRLKMMGLGLFLYSNDHGGDFPASLNVLLEQGYLKEEPDFLKCPKTGSPYAYVAGLRDDAQPMTIVVYDSVSGAHQDGKRNALHADGHVAPKSEAQFAKIALRDCPECKRKIAETAKACPHCGYAPDEVAPPEDERVPEGGGFPERGLVAYYQFDGNAKDSSGNANHGAVVGAELTSDAFGRRGMAYSFDGKDDIIEVPDAPTLRITSSITIAAWINPTIINPVIAHTIVYKRNDPIGGPHTDCYGLTTDRGGGEIIFVFGPNSHITTSGYALPMNKWTHVAATFDDAADELRFYKNGLLHQVISTGKTIHNTNDPLAIGAFRSAGGSPAQGFSGGIDEVRIYNRVLTAQEIGMLSSDVRAPEDERVPEGGGFAARALDDDFEDNNISDWQNHPMVRNVVSYNPPGLNPLPRVRNGRVQGVGTGNNRICPWMVKPVSLPNADELRVTLKGKSGSDAMNQAGLWLLDESWAGDLRPAVGYEILIYGEDAQSLRIYRYDADGSSTEIARFKVGTAIHYEHKYVVSRDSSGDWSVSMDGDPLKPSFVIPDATYTSFSHVGVHFNNEQSEFNHIRLEAQTRQAGNESR